MTTLKLWTYHWSELASITIYNNALIAKQKRRTKISTKMCWNINRKYSHTQLNSGKIDILFQTLVGIAYYTEANDLTFNENGLLVILLDWSVKDTHVANPAYIWEYMQLTKGRRRAPIKTTPLKSFTSWLNIQTPHWKSDAICCAHVSHISNQTRNASKFKQFKLVSVRISTDNCGARSRHVMAHRKIRPG